MPKRKIHTLKQGLSYKKELNESRQLVHLFMAKEEDVRALKDLLYSGANISQTTSDTKKWNAHFAAVQQNTNM